jgi:hypothetical protein
VPILIVTAVAELLALVLRCLGIRAYAAWALALGTLPALAQMTIEFSADARRGAAMTASDEWFLAAELAILGLALVSLLLSRGLAGLSHAFFWLGWTLNLALVVLLAYLAFFWRMF